MDITKKVFSIHFPERKVYVVSTHSEINKKMEDIKNDKDNIIYRYFNPLIIEEENTKEEVINNYTKESYNILNFNYTKPRFNLFQSLYKWMGY